jgi:hypothetical protein
LPFASPFGSLGRPILAFFCAKVSRFLQDRCSHRILGRFDRMEMQHCDVPHWFIQIVSFVRPRINSVCRSVSR